MTNREAHEEAAGMGLCNEFFAVSGIDPDAEYEEMNDKYNRRNKMSNNFMDLRSRE